MEFDDQQLHPNLARIAAAYDKIIEETDAGRITPAKARSMIALLEARDDHGVRWSIDPDTGEFVRKTAFGELEYDTPPSYGVLTHDPYTLSGAGTDPNDPNLRINVAQVDEILAPPSSLSGATASAAPQFSSAPGALRRKHVPWWAKAGAVGGAAVLVLGGTFLAYKQLTAPASTPTPTPAPTETVEPTSKPKPSKSSKPKKDKGGQDAGGNTKQDQQNAQ